MNWPQGLLISLLISSAFGAEIPAQPSPVPSSSPTNVVAETLNKLRDPFKRPAFKGALLSNKGDLESFSVETLKVVGILTGPNRIRALIMAPDGRSHLVTEKTKVGIRGGIVKKITPEGILVREKVVNVIGQEENIDTEIQLTAAGNRTLHKDNAPVQSINSVGIDAESGIPVQKSTPISSGGVVQQGYGKGVTPTPGM